MTLKFCEKKDERNSIVSVSFFIFKNRNAFKFDRETKSRIQPATSGVFLAKQMVCFHAFESFDLVLKLSTLQLGAIQM